MIRFKFVIIRLFSDKMESRFWSAIGLTEYSGPLISFAAEGYPSQGKWKR